MTDKDSVVILRTSDLHPVYSGTLLELGAVRHTYFDGVALSPGRGLMQLDLSLCTGRNVHTPPQQALRWWQLKS